MATAARGCPQTARAGPCFLAPPLRRAPLLSLARSPRPCRPMGTRPRARRLRQGATRMDARPFSWVDAPAPHPPPCPNLFCDLGRVSTPPHRLMPRHAGPCYFSVDGCEPPAFLPAVLPLPAAPALVVGAVRCPSTSSPFTSVQVRALPRCRHSTRVRLRLPPAGTAGHRRSGVHVPHLWSTALPVPCGPWGGLGGGGPTGGTASPCRRVGGSRSRWRLRRLSRRGRRRPSPQRCPHPGRTRHKGGSAGRRPGTRPRSDRCPRCTRLPGAEAWRS